MQINNIFQYPNLNVNSSKEYFEAIFMDENIKIEKIYSSGQSSPIGQWLKEKVNEFVYVVEGCSSINFKKENMIYTLKKGDYFIIPKGTEHRVENTDSENITTWLTIHFK